MNSLIIDNYSDEELHQMDADLVRNKLQYSILIKKLIKEKMGDEVEEKMILDLSEKK